MSNSTSWRPSTLLYASMRDLRLSFIPLEANRDTSDGDGGAAVFFFCGPGGAHVMRACRCLFILLLFLYGGLVTVQAFTGTYGINYGRIADNIPPPETVVAYLKEAKIKNGRIYDGDHSVLEAFKGSGLELVVGIPNEYLKNMSTNEDQAVNWIKENVQAYLPDAYQRDRCRE